VSEHELDLRHDSRYQRSVLITIVAANNVGHLLAPGDACSGPGGEPRRRSRPVACQCSQASGDDPSDIEHRQREE
jgi:hypothetical protein